MRVIGIEILFVIPAAVVALPLYCAFFRRIGVGFVELTGVAFIVLLVSAFGTPVTGTAAALVWKYVLGNPINSPIMSDENIGFFIFGFIASVMLGLVGYARNCIGPERQAEIARDIQVDKAMRAWIAEGKARRAEALRAMTPEDRTVEEDVQARAKAGAAILRESKAQSKARAERYWASRRA
jgi:hypothetical protein